MDEFYPCGFSYFLLNLINFTTMHWPAAGCLSLELLQILQHDADFSEWHVLVVMHVGVG